MSENFLSGLDNVDLIIGGTGLLGGVFVAGCLYAGNSSRPGPFFVAGATVPISALLLLGRHLL